MGRVGTLERSSGDLRLPREKRLSNCGQVFSSWEVTTLLSNPFQTVTCKMPCCVRPRVLSNERPTDGAEMIQQLKNRRRTMFQSYDAISLTGLPKRLNQGGLGRPNRLARESARLWRSLALSTIHCVVLALAMLGANLQLACAQESSDIAKQAQNPIASLISVPLENDFNPHTGVTRKTAMCSR